MKNVFFISLLFLPFALCLADSPRIDQTIGAGWKFSRENPLHAEKKSFNDSYWENISIPHTWNALDGQDGGDDFYRGYAWYRRSLNLDQSHKEKMIYLKFDGSSSNTQLYVNEKPVGNHKGSFGAFCFDITPFVSFDSPNLIAVKVTNAKDSTIAPLRGDFTIYGGIYRNVHLIVTEKLAISPVDHASPGVYLTQTEVSDKSAAIEIKTKLKNDFPHDVKAEVLFTIIDRDGKTAAQGKMEQTVPMNSSADAVQKTTIKKPNLWNGKIDPYLYSVTIELRMEKKIVDRIVQSLGIRSFSIDPEKGFFLNGKPYPLHGVNRHQDREKMGWAITEKEHGEDMAIIKEIGANAIRLAHYQHAEEFYDLCDQNGMVVWAELALVDDVHPSPEFLSVCKEQLRELIKQNYNHPSIFCWSLQNELVPDADTALYGNVVRELNNTAKSLDQTRFTAVASRSKYDAADGINAASDIIGYNVYRGWYEGQPDGFARYADTLHKRFPAHRFCISEYGAGASINQHEWPAKKPPTRGKWHPEEWQSILHEVTYKAMLERPFIWGTFIWNMFDFGSDKRSEGEHFGQNDKGIVSFDRKVRKDVFYFYKAHWNPDPIVYITSRRFTPRRESVTDVKVYSNCVKVQLFVNGTAQQELTSSDKIFVWKNVALSSGRNVLRAVAAGKGKSMEDACEWVVETK